jgi:hypothetical protein
VLFHILLKPRILNPKQPILASSLLCLFFAYLSHLQPRAPLPKNHPPHNTAAMDAIKQVHAAPQSPKAFPSVAGKPMATAVPPSTIGNMFRDVAHLPALPFLQLSFELTTMIW